MTVYKLFLSILCVYRLARIVSRDTISEQARAALGRQAAGSKRYSLPWYLAELVNCPLCVGVWIAFVVALLAAPKKQKLSEYFLNAFAIAGGQTIISLWIDGSDI